MIDCINRNYIGKPQLYTGNRDWIRDSQLYNKDSASVVSRANSVNFLAFIPPS